MVKDYYLILEVNRNASEQAIKHNYRRLALKYHPDKNNGAKAHDLFLLINEAYQVLGNPEKRRHYNYIYDQLRASRNYYQFQSRQKTTYNHQFNNQKNRRRPSGNAYRKTRRNYSFNHTAPFREPDINYRNYAKYFRMVSLAGFLFCLLLFIDYLMVNTYPYQIVENRKNFSQSAVMYSSENLAAVSLNNYNPPVDRTNFYLFERGDKVNVYKTPIFGITTQVERERNGNIEVFNPNTNIYNVFSFLLLILFITSSSGLFIKKRPEYTFNAGVSSGILLPVVFYLVFFT